MNIFRQRRGHGSIAFVLSVTFLSLLLLRPSASAQSSVAAEGELKTVAMVAVAPYEKLIGDVTALGEVVGRPEIGQMMEGGFAFFTQGKGPEALDKTRPWGVIVQTDGAAFLAVGCLPTAKPGAVLDVARAVGVQVNDAVEGVHEVVLPNQKSAYVREQGGWAYIGLSREALSRLPQNPQAILAELVTEYDVAARISMKDVPEMYRQFAVQMMQAGIQQQMQQQEDETAEQYELRQKMIEAQMAQTTRTVNETDAITLGLAIDAENKRTYLDFAQTFVPGSKMARQIAAYGEPRTNFAGFYQPDAAATVSFATKADPELIEQDIEYFESSMQTLRAGIERAIDDSDSAKHPEAVKAALSDWFDALEATIRAGHIDGGAALDVRPDSLTFVAGAVVKDTAKFEEGLRKLEAAAAKDDPEFPGIRWNAATHGGVQFHTLDAPLAEENEEARKLLGEEVNLTVGIGPEAVYLAGGRDNLDALKRAIDASAKEPNKAVRPFELSIALTPIMEMAAAKAEEEDQKAIAQKVVAMLRDEAAGRDHIRAAGQLIPNGLRYRFAAEEGVLRAIGAAANEAQRQALQANQ